MSISDPSSYPQYGRWKHDKGGLYEIVGFGTIEKTLEAAVIYREIGSSRNGIWIRPCYEFFDGRFTLVPTTK